MKESSKPDLIRLFGGPGSGKTTALLNEVENLLDSGIEIRELLLVSYTRAAATELRDRLGKRLEIEPESLRKNVSTMHAKAYELLKLSRKGVVSDSNRKEWCSDKGLEYEEEYKSGGRRTTLSTSLGNKILETSQWIQRTSGDVDDWFGVPFTWDIEKVRYPQDMDPKAQVGNKYTPTWSSGDNRLSIPDLIQDWKEYKIEKKIIGFADMLELVHERELIPKVSNLVVDEFQDITQLQYKIYQQWKCNMKNVIIAGDDDQVVYAWQGADPMLLLGETGTDIILDNSYRLPSEILSVVQQVIDHVEIRQDKNLKPRTSGGSVEFLRDASVLDLVRKVKSDVSEEVGTIMVLFRARYQMFEFIEEFVKLGIPFSMMTDGNMWTEKLSRYVSAVEEHSRGVSLNGEQVALLADILVDSAFGMRSREELLDCVDAEMKREKTKDKTSVKFAQEFIRKQIPFMPSKDVAADMLRRVTKYQIKCVKSYFNGKYQHLNYETVKIGTIHSSKGREADRVYISTDLTEKVVEHMSSEVPEGIEYDPSNKIVPVLTDSERRVFYVGMSRAREGLVVMENLVKSAPTLPIEVLLNNEFTGKSLEEITKGI